MGSLPVLKPRQVIALLEAHGFAEVRQRGSHKQFRHPDGRTTTVPFHAGRDISPTLLRKIAATSISPSRSSSARDDDAAIQQGVRPGAPAGRCTFHPRRAQLNARTLV